MSRVPPQRALTLPEVPWLMPEAFIARQVSTISRRRAASAALRRRLATAQSRSEPGARVAQMTLSSTPLARGRTISVRASAASGHTVMASQVGQGL